MHLSAVMCGRGSGMNRTVGSDICQIVKVPVQNTRLVLTVCSHITWVLSRTFLESVQFLNRPHLISTFVREAEDGTAGRRESGDHSRLLPACL